MFERGDKLLAAGKIAEACAAFEASNNIDPRAGTLIRLGQCREQNHELASAWTAYKDAVARARDPRKRDIANARIADLEPRLSTLTIVTDHAVAGLAITRDGASVEPATWGHTLPVDGGRYLIAARAPGFEPWQATVEVPEQRGRVEVAIPELRPSPKPVEPPPATVSPAHPRVVPQAPPLFTPRRKVAVGAAGLGAASLVTGAVLGAVASSRRDDAFRLCPDPSAPCGDAARADAAAASGHRFAIGADVAFGLAALGVLGAGVLWVTGKPERTMISPTTSGVAITGVF
jgi:hypothetical protein